MATKPKSTVAKKVPAKNAAAKKVVVKKAVKTVKVEAPVPVKRPRGRPPKEGPRIAEMRLNIFIEPRMKLRFIKTAKGVNNNGTAASVVRGLVDRWLAGTLNIPVVPSALRDPKRTYTAPLPKMGVDLPAVIYLEFKAQTALQGYSMSAVTLSLIQHFLAGNV